MRDDVYFHCNEDSGIALGSSGSAISAAGSFRRDSTALYFIKRFVVSAGIDFDCTTWTVKGFGAIWSIWYHLLNMAAATWQTRSSCSLHEAWRCSHYASTVYAYVP